MKSFPPVSIVVPAYNMQKTIGKCLEALLDQDYPEKEIIVVDDGSTDGTEEIIKKYPVTLLSQSNLGASAARNNGLKNTKHELVAYTDGDTRVSKDWLKNMVLHFSDNKVGAVTGKTIFGVDEHCTSYIRSLDIEERNAKRNKYTSLANGPNSAFRKDLLFKIGGFDPKWYHAEDTEVSYKILKEGYRIVYEPRALVNHVPEDDWKKFLKKRYRDAKAFTRILYSHLPRASVKDDYVTASMKLQPPLFAVILFFSMLILLSYVFGVMTSGLFAVWSVLIIVAISMNIPFSYRVSKRSKKPSFFIKALLLTVGRGFCWGLGLIIGGIQNFRDYFWKARSR